MSSFMRMIKKAVLIGAAALAFSAALPLCAAAEEKKSYTYETGFSAEHDLAWVFSSFSEYFNTGEWDIEEAVLNLRFSSTPLALTEISNFTVSINGQRFYSTRIPDSKGEAIEMQIPIELSAIKEGVNTLTIESYIRTSLDQPCRDDLSKASWMTVFKDSSVKISYVPTAKVKTVADLYRQLTSIEALDNSQSAFYINASPNNTELTAVSYALSGISGNAVTAYNSMELIPVTSAKDLTSKKFGVYISEYAMLNSDIRDRLSEEQKLAAEEGAIMALLNPADGVSLLVVTGADAKALLNAGNLFGHKNLLSQALFTWRKVANAEDVSFKHKSVNKGKTISLTEKGAYVKGPFRQEAMFTVEAASNLAVRTGSRIDLDFRYSENLDFNRSLLTVYVNGTPIGSKKLSKENAGADTFSVMIPENLDVTGSFSVTAAFDLEVQDLWCTVRQEEMPWAYVSNESTVKLNTTASDYLLFDYYPSPFISGGRFNDTVVIVPDSPTAAELEALRGVMLTLGRFLKDNSGSLRVVRGQAADDLSSSNLIVIGALSRIPMISEINDSLFYKFSPGGTTVVSNEKVLIDANYGALLGTAQLIYSPLSKDKKALLLVSGVNERNVLKAADYLSDSEGLWQLEGDGYISDGDRLLVHRFKEDNKKTRSWFKRFISDPGLLMAAACAAAVGLILVLTAIVLIKKRRRR